MGDCKNDPSKCGLSPFACGLPLFMLCCVIADDIAAAVAALGDAGLPLWRVCFVTLVGHQTGEAISSAVVDCDWFALSPSFFGC